MTKTIAMLDPRQAKAIYSYTSPNSPTFGNLKQSLISAGYDELYAGTIHNRKPDWLTDNLDTTVSMIQKAESNLSKLLQRPIDFTDDSKFNAEMIKLQNTASQFVLKTLGRKKYESEDESAKQAPQIQIINFNSLPAQTEPSEVREATVSPSDSEE